jgi:hypothetical protein
MLAREKVPFDIVVEDTIKGFDSARTVYTVKSSGNKLDLYYVTFHLLKLK